MTDKKTFLDKVHQHLFADDQTRMVVFDADEFEIVKRYKDIYSLCLDDPWKPDKSLVTYIKQTYEVSKSTAYKDLSNVRILLSNVRNADKEFQRYTANQMVREGYKKAMDAESLTEVKQAEAMIRAGQALVKINKLDQDEAFRIDPDDVKVDEFEASSDITILGLEKRYKDNDELEAAKARMRKRFGGEPQKIQDAQIITDEQET